tara:strand:+ start:133936 stop:134943 length:1008 start_codon:yes stop_codon:yes gene_type:complete
MDPLSQATLGAIVPQAFNRNRKKVIMATIAGAIGGMAPDLDVIIRSESDSLLFLEYHRQFTHSLIFIPIGGLICAAFLWLILKKWRGDFKSLYIFSTLGYATHGILDSCTSYGTQLLWPFSNYRVSWDTISIIDPLFTLPLVIAVFLGILRKSNTWPIAGIIFGLLYMGAGWFQHDRAITAARTLAQSRNHTPISISAKPSFANLLVFKTIYDTEDSYFVDAVRVGQEVKIYPGESIEKFQMERDFPNLDPDSQTAIDIKRFSWFSQGFLALHPEKSNHIIDVRYSMVPNQIQPLWGIGLDPLNTSKHVRYEVYGRNPKKRGPLLLKMIRGEPLN